MSGGSQNEAPRAVPGAAAGAAAALSATNTTEAGDGVSGGGFGVAKVWGLDVAGAGVAGVLSGAATGSPPLVCESRRVSPRLRDEFCVP